MLASARRSLLSAPLLLAVAACAGGAGEPAPPAPPAPVDAAAPDAAAVDRIPEDVAAPDLPASDATPDRPGADAGQVADGVQARCQPAPAASNAVIPFFELPFTGTFRVSNHFDHDVPKEFEDMNGHQLDWCGRRRTREIDGHRGYDFVMPVGTPLLAPADGVVNLAGKDIRFFCPLEGEFVTDQLVVEITHTLPNGQRVTSMFKHLSRVDVAVRDRVRTGQQIGLSGNSGCSTGPHLHFETWRMDGTNNGRSVLIDAYGWEGEGPDPWASRPEGAASIWLWKPGQAPHIFGP